MGLKSSDFIQTGLSSLPPPVGVGFWSGYAAVLVPLVNYGENYSLLLTRRAEHLSQHPGEVAFPGGMWEEGDHFPTGTALREAQEEAAIPPESVQLLGSLPPLTTRRGTQVTPVVGIIPRETQFVASPDEIDTIFSVPLVDLVPDNRVRTDVFSRISNQHWAPAYDYQGYEIWGFTAAVIKMLLERCFQTPFVREHSAPEKFW